MPEDADVPAEARDYANRILTDHESLTGPVEVSEFGDFEDFWEEAARSHALIAGSGGNFWVQDEKQKTLTHFTTGEVIEHAPAVTDNRWGSQPGTAHYRYGIDWISRNPQASLVDSYWRLPGFLRNCGRKFEVLTMPRHSEEHEGLKELLEQWPFESAFIKLGSRKSVTPEKIAASMKGWYGSDISMATLTLRDDLLVQECVPMRFEYRMFVAGGEIRTGAGNVELHTPLDNPTQVQFDDKMESVRNASEVTSEPGLRDRYVEFGQRVATELAKEGALNYSLDVALNPDTGEILVVELNSLTNSGLYACDPVRIVEGLL